MKTLQSSSGVERTDVILLTGKSWAETKLLLVSKTQTLLFLGNCLFVSAGCQFWNLTWWDGPMPGQLISATGIP